ncbi:Clan S-, family S54, Rhomboid-like serine peptidase [Tritrichomonas foetus]|uniref:Clan S-, family S54, Rhomboid-like serine peptidase n=1 Tax=Tritrichomonas foetus TaxID=1144522 RepID=A0A1J4JG97_9EUKA|nr:Clan S-, family S54, Rhomboid-like serine peptidase [Tritrichomonas foetus]|eukprot:OHS97681.1 Clan S-, family S54, Rhomboid-like serine peptidase [Tritrichomonas foetus]
MQEFLHSLHFGTRFLLIFMVVIYLIQFLLLDSKIESYLTFCPAMIIEKFQFWRLISGMFLHGGILHLAMNMLSFTSLGMTFESQVGTLSYFFHILIFGIIEGLIHILIAVIMNVGGDPSAWHSHAVGFSGVLFALIVVDISLSGGEDRSVLGLFLVPSWVYPWVMLLLMSLLVPNASFLGHLSGMVAGYLYQFKVLKFVTPPVRVFSAIERKCCCCCLNRLGYIAAEGMAGARPWAVFQHTFRNDGDDPERQYGFQGTGRTLGDAGVTPNQLDVTPTQLSRDDEATNYHHNSSHQNQILDQPNNRQIENLNGESDDEELDDLGGLNIRLSDGEDKKDDKDEDGERPYA